METNPGLEKLLAVIGDLELTRRQLLIRISDLEEENAALSAKSNGGQSSDQAPTMGA